MTNILALALAAAFAAAAAHPSPAAGDHRQSSTVVTSGDLDVATAEGREQLERRIAAAARRVCRSTDKMTLHERGDVAECISSATARAARDVELALKGASPASTGREFAQRR
jgi:UrcA family protein